MNGSTSSASASASTSTSGNPANTANPVHIALAPVAPVDTPVPSTPTHPVITLLARYQAVFQAAWSHRAELAGPARCADEIAFLPAALSLQETPVHPAPRRLAWGLMLLFVLALVWSIFGQVDIVAVAPGRIIVSERTKVIQPLEASPMAKKREADFKKLVKQGYISGHATQDKTRERIELEYDLATQRARLAEAQFVLKETVQAKAVYRAETLRLLNDRNAQAATTHQQRKADHAKAIQRERLTHLTAPVDGVIQQLAIHTTGGVVTSAQPLMIVVPDVEQVSAEVSIANQDIGFVNAGQIAAVKLETFPYTKYGTVSATVDIVTADAVTDEKKGSYYPATLTLSQKDMVIDGKRVRLSPGMNITAEIKTGHRRIIEFLLSSVQRAGSESLRER